MLVAALVVTLVGFVLLVVALITSSVAFAWACIVICLIGLGLLIADVFVLRRRGKTTPESPSEVVPAEGEDPPAAVEDPSEQAVEGHLSGPADESAVWGPDASDQAEESIGRQSGEDTQ